MGVRILTSSTLGRALALRWVQTPDGSSHTAGDAVDVGATDAAYWLSQHGGELGLCQTYANEIWHHELTLIQKKAVLSPGERGSRPEGAA